ncbi:MAG: outer membrane lipoprotein-sorting protein [Terriglobia bacterium]|jgi:outer membrane lipoprotein-sorting protein
MFRTFLTILAGMALLAPAARAQTVDEIIAKNVEALGGMDKLQSVKTLRMNATLKMGSFQAAMKSENKRPDKVRDEFILQGMAQVSAYDGKAGWQVNPFQGRKDPEMLSADDTKGLQVEADIDGPLVNYQQKGSTAELVGHDSVEGTDCYKIKLTLKNGDARIYYLDADSYMVIKLETQTFIRGSLQERETYYGDYEKVDGIYYPFSSESAPKDQPDRVQITLDKVEVNVPLDDSRFAVPGGKSEAKGSGGST